MAYLDSAKPYLSTGAKYKELGPSISEQTQLSINYASPRWPRPSISGAPPLYQGRHPACMLISDTGPLYIRLGVDMEQLGTDLAGQLLNCSGLSLHDLDDLDSSTFAYAMRGLMDPERRDTEAIAGFNSFVSSLDID